MLARLRVHLTAVAIALTVAGSSAGAQEIAAPPVPNDAPVAAQSMDVTSTERGVDVAVEAAVAGPVMSGASIAARADLQATSSADAAAMMQSRDRRGTTLMLVGGAAFLAGLLIGDDAGTAVALGGAIVGLYGLYMYLQ